MLITTTTIIVLVATMAIARTTVVPPMEAAYKYSAAIKPRPFATVLLYMTNLEDGNGGETNEQPALIGKEQKQQRYQQRQCHDNIGSNSNIHPVLLNPKPLSDLHPHRI